MKVIRRDNFCCRLCKKGPFPEKELICDHIIPLQEGGQESMTDLSNLQTLCQRCNHLKSLDENRRRFKRNPNA